MINTSGSSVAHFLFQYKCVFFTFLGMSLSGSVVCSEADKMEHVYGNVEYELCKTSGNERCRVSTDVSGHAVQSVRERKLKVLLAALGLLLLCALVALCVLGILYYNKGVSYEALSEQYSSAVERLSVQERSTGECQKCALYGKGWRPFGLKCYYFSTDELNWTMNRDYCAEKGGHLVIITSQAEQDFVSSRVGENHWIGLNDLETEGKWMWVNNQTLTETGVTFWHKRKNQQDEPDNWKYDDPSGENCGSLGNEGGNADTWFDASCRKRKKYICEK